MDGLPPFTPTNTYSVRINLGNGPPERLDLGFGDCGCYDNTGGYIMTLASEACAH